MRLQSTPRLSYSERTIVKAHEECPDGGGLIVSADYCLTGDTEIITEFGVMKLVDVVEKKPKVLACSPKGKLSFKKVTESIAIGVEPVYEVCFKDGSYIRCTDEHKWMLPSGDFAKTKDLERDTHLRRIDTTHVSKDDHVVCCIRFCGMEMVYQITVSKWHTYVLANGLVSKNSQLELRVLAALTQDEQLIGAFVAGYDLHQFVASVISYIDPHKIKDLSNSQKKELVETYQEKSIPEFVELIGPETDYLVIADILADPKNVEVYNTIRYKAVTKKQRSGAKCVHPDTLVWTSKGPQLLGKIAQFSNTADSFQPCNVNVALTNTEYVTAIKTYNGGVKPRLHVVTKRGILTCSEDHLFLLQDGKSFVRAKDLEKGQLLAAADIPVIKDREYSEVTMKLQQDIPAFKVKPTHSLAYFAGLFLGDGSQCSGKHVMITHGDVRKTDRLGTSYAVWQNVIKHAVEDVGFLPRLRECYVGLGERKAWDYLKHLELVEHKGNTYGRRLRIPSWILSAGKEALLHFLGGLFDTDGTISKRGTAAVMSKDPVFIGQLAAVMQGIGLAINVEPCWNKTYSRWYYRLHVTTKLSNLLKPYMRHPGKLKRFRNTSITIKRPPNKVMQVIPAGDGLCLDLELNSKDHVYLTNSIITHNCVQFGLVYGAGPEKVAEQAGMTVKDAKRFIADYFARFPKIKDYIDNRHYLAGKYHKAYSPTGRIRHLDALFAAGSVEAALRQSQNTPIQGAGSEICVMAIIMLMQAYKEQKFKSLVAGSIHDSILSDIFPGEFMSVAPLIKNTMEGVNKLPGFTWMQCPLVADLDVGVSWGQLVGIKKFKGNRIYTSGTPEDTSLLLIELDKSYQINTEKEEVLNTPDGIIVQGCYALK